MNLLDSLLALIAPHECVRCAAEGRLLCVSCVASLPEVVPKILSGGGQLRARTIYNSAAKALIWRLKAGSARAAATEVAHLLPGCSQGVVVPVPTAASRVRQRGYDQARLIAHDYARLHGLPVATHLVRLTHSRQVGASRSQRLAQLEHAFRVTNQSRLRGAHIILVDDVSTTGATLETAARLLLAAGARHVEAVVFARVS